MTLSMETRTVESGAVTEIYISATPTADAPAEKQAEEIFSGIRDILRSKKAHILQERLFTVRNATETVRTFRSKVFGDIDDGVTPSFLLGRRGAAGPLAGVQVHAIIGDRPQTINLDGVLCGRIFRTPERSFLTLSGISAKGVRERPRQARAMLEKAQTALKQFGADFICVPRTWMWLGDILTWYNDFNKVRNQFFIERGLIGKGSRQSMPASTGIGLALAGGGKCGMDLTAVLAPADSIEFLAAVGRQQCALEYGSAFSRASRTVTPAGQTVYVSGTASIDAKGVTTSIGDIPGQIENTIENVRAVLKDMDCRDDDVVQVVAYCKTTEVEKVFNGLRSRLAWPWITVICDICRDDLLFEIEAAAMPRR